MMSLMTSGAWCTVRPTDEGDIAVCDAYGIERPARKLSLGTRQQMYLAFRIALLICADDVGRSLPVLADDILVNFDDERREGAVLPVPWPSWRVLDRLLYSPATKKWWTL